MPVPGKAQHAIGVGEICPSGYYLFYAGSMFCASVVWTQQCSRKEGERAEKVRRVSEELWNVLSYYLLHQQ